MNAQDILKEVRNKAQDVLAEVGVKGKVRLYEEMNFLLATELVKLKQQHGENLS